MQKDIRHTWFFEHPPETVWEFLTGARLLSQWLMENDFKLVVGHRFTFTTKPKIKLGFDGIIYCEVLEIIPLQRLVYSWKGGPGKGVITLDSVVTWTLVPTTNGTALTIEHRGFKGIKNYFGFLAMNQGWKTRIRKRFARVLDNYKQGFITGNEAHN